MKKIYFEPETEIVELETFNLLSASDLDNIDNGGSDGGVGGSGKDASDTSQEGWTDGF